MSLGFHPDSLWDAYKTPCEETETWLSLHLSLQWGPFCTVTFAFNALNTAQKLKFVNIF